MEHKSANIPYSRSDTMRSTKNLPANKRSAEILSKSAALSVFALFIIFVYKCPIRMIFGIECPGCGLKRAFRAAVSLDFTSAFHYHPLFPLIGGLCLYVVLTVFFPKLRVFKKAELVIGIVTLLLLAAVWIYRIFF